MLQSLCICLFKDHMNFKQDLIYLDYAATTPCDERVLKEMSEANANLFGNPNSLHRYGEDAMSALSIARSRICKLLKSNNYEIIFTSGATESNKIAINRTLKKLAKNKKNHFITFKSEHKSVLEAANTAKNDDIEVSLLEVEKDGIINLENLANHIKSTTGLVSVCYINNETGVMQDIKKIAELCHKHEILLHIDATQAFGKIDIDVNDLDVDMLSASGHKIYGPKGIGILYCKKKCQTYIRMPFSNLDIEYGIRSGTTPVPICFGFGIAAQIAQQEMHENYQKIKRLREKFIIGIQNQLSEIYINGSQTQNYPGIINMSFRGCEGEALMMEADKIAIASGSACTSNRLTISHVLDSMGISHDIAQSSLRISIGKYTTDDDINIAVENLVSATKKLRNISPIWDMIQAGIDIDTFFTDKIYHR